MPIYLTSLPFGYIALANKNGLEAIPMAAMGCMGEMGRRPRLHTLAGKLRLVLVPIHAVYLCSEGWTHFCGFGSYSTHHQCDHSGHGDQNVAAPGTHRTGK